jgi:hypothetical protein
MGEGEAAPPHPAELNLDFGGIHRATGALLVVGIAEILVGAAGLAVLATAGSRSAVGLGIVAVAVVTGVALLAVAVRSARPAARARRHAAVVGGTGILLAYHGTYVALGWDAVERVMVHRPGSRSRSNVVIVRLVEDSPVGDDPVLEPFRFPDQAVRLGLPDDKRNLFVGVLARGAAGRAELRVLRGLAGGRLAVSQD